MWGLRVFVWFLMLIASEEASAFLKNTIDTLEFIEHNVLNIGMFLVSAVRFFQPDIDNMFLMSLQFVDGVYKKKHPETTRNFYRNLLMYHGGSIEKIAGPPLAETTEKKLNQEGYPQFDETLHQGPEFNDGITPPPLPPRADLNDGSAPPPLPPRDFTTTNAKTTPVPSHSTEKAASSQKSVPVKGPKWKQYINSVLSLKKNNKGFSTFLQKSLKRSGISLALYFLSGFPFIGRFMVPAASFYSLHRVIGTPAALGIFAVGLSVRRRYMFMFLSSFWGSRSLVHDLLSPYFSRVPFSRSDRDHWFKAREGIMFGFGFAFYWIMRIPFVGVLVYGIAEASSAYLITKVSEPLPTPGPELYQWVENEITWTKKDNFLSGLTLNTDGFGETVNVPGSWVSQEAERKK